MKRAPDWLMTEPVINCSHQKGTAERIQVYLIWKSLLWPPSIVEYGDVFYIITLYLNTFYSPLGREKYVREKSCLFNVLEITHDDHNYRYLLVLDFITNNEFNSDDHKQAWSGPWHENCSPYLRTRFTIDTWLTLILFLRRALTRSESAWPEQIFCQISFVFIKWRPRTTNGMIDSAQQFALVFDDFAWLGEFERFADAGPPHISLFTLQQVHMFLYCHSCGVQNFEN